MNGDWAGRDVLVTGAGRGLGAGIAEGFVREGATVWICADHARELQSTARRLATLGETPRTLVVDLAEPAGCAEVVRWISAGSQDLRTVVNNAAVLSRTPVADLSLEVWNRTLAVNLTAPFLLARDLLPHMNVGGGAIINVSSMAGVRASREEAAYCASKFGIEGLTRCMALDLTGRSISVNSVTPGMRIKPTSLTEAQAQSIPEEERAAWRDPAGLSPAFLFLAGLTGQVTGRRFDALELTRALARWGPDETLARIDEVAVS